MSIPLVRNNTKDAINTSIIAIKKNLERINSLLGLADSSEPDLSGLATKQELEDTVTEINNTIDEVETSLQPVDTVTSGNMHSVTSNAVAEYIQRTSYGFKIGNLKIELISIKLGTITFTNGRVSISNPYTFQAPFTDFPNVILNSINDVDYGYCTVIGIVRDIQKIKILSLLRDTSGTYNNIYVKGIAIGV
jgi:tetrahydromethanopterin S-methyltransferase subunit B